MPPKFEESLKIKGTFKDERKSSLNKQGKLGQSQKDNSYQYLPFEHSVSESIVSKESEKHKQEMSFFKQFLIKQISDSKYDFD